MRKVVLIAAMGSAASLAGEVETARAQVALDELTIPGREGLRVVLIADGVRDLTGSWELRCHLFFQVHLKFIFNSCRYRMKKNLPLTTTETAYERSSVLLLCNSGP